MQNPLLIKAINSPFLENPPHTINSLSARYYYSFHSIHNKQYFYYASSTYNMYMLHNYVHRCRPTIQGEQARFACKHFFLGMQVWSQEVQPKLSTLTANSVLYEPSNRELFFYTKHINTFHQPTSEIIWMYL